jgi:hypothetical protein
LLQRDWFTTQTLQYHGAFTWVCVELMRWKIIEPAFLIGYLGLAILLQVGWLQWTKILGGNVEVYLLSVLFFEISGGGFGLGMYEFLQDRCVLASNLASVAMLWGFYFWVAQKPTRAGMLLGFAGLFHLNYAIAGVAIWMGLCASNAWRKKGAGFPVSGTVLLVALCMPSVWPAARAVLAQGRGMRLGEFVAIYVRLRHPHHYDPSSWPIALWLSFLWPFVPAIWIACRSEITESRRQTYRIFGMLALLLAVALLGAGIWYISEGLIQMSLFRFSIFLKLLSCIGAACAMRKWIKPWAITLAAICAGGMLIVAQTRTGAWAAENKLVLLAAAAVCLTVAAYAWITARAWRSMLATCLLAAGVAGFWTHWGVRWPGLERESTDEVALCDWVRANTPVDAVFLTPPQEEAFRLHAQRAVVVNFKCVPQLSGELALWRDRMEAVLDEPLSALPHRYDLALAAMGHRYDAVDAGHLRSVAARYGAQYVVTKRLLPGMPAALFENGAYHLYALEQQP